MRDLDSDTRRWRWLLLASALLVVLVLMLAGADSLRPEWLGHQEEARHNGLISELPGILEVTACDGSADRCQSCHVAIEQNDPEGRPRHSMPLDAHPAARFGCATCHGGTPRALEQDAAHALVGTDERDALMMTPHIEASCVRCHLPGEVIGTERLVRGINLYFNLGCAMCHSLSEGGRGSWDYGPDLRSIGRKSLKYLRDSITEPTANFPDSTMPSYRDTFAERPEAYDDLLIFVQSLALEYSAQCVAPSRGDLDGAPCASCHAGQDGHAGGRLQHRCVYLKERAAVLRCSNCHPGAMPEPGAFEGYCPVVREHRGGCAACHSGRRP